MKKIIKSVALLHELVKKAKKEESLIFEIPKLSMDEEETFEYLKQKNMITDYEIPSSLVESIKITLNDDQFRLLQSLPLDQNTWDVVLNKLKESLKIKI